MAHSLFYRYSFPVKDYRHLPGPEALAVMPVAQGAVYLHVTVTATTILIVVAARMEDL